MRTLERLSPQERRLAEEFARRVRRRFGDRLLEMRVFGSRARGEAHEESDLDIWVLLDRAGWDELKQVSGIATDFVLEQELPVIAPLVMGRDQYERLVSLERLLTREIARDGIPL